MKTCHSENYPRLVASIPKLKSNAQKIIAWCQYAGIGVTFVGKCITEDERLVLPILECGMDSLADSRISNLEHIDTTLPKMLLRIGMPDQAEKIVNTVDISLQSEFETILALNRTAEKNGVQHKVILMIDLGDLREGVFYTDRDEILRLAGAVVHASHLELYGIGTNLTCYGSIVPDEENLGELCRIAEMIEAAYNIKLSLISGGNSSSLGLILSGKIPEGINNLRIGEALLLGTDTATGKKFADLRDDAFILETELVEVKEKPSFPVGTRSVDAFGKVREYVDRGIIKRGILAIGRQDLPIEELIPLDDSVSIIGGSSDHLIVDLSNTSAVVGDVLRFKLTYGALLGAYTSKYVSKVVLE